MERLVGRFAVVELSETPATGRGVLFRVFDHDLNVRRGAGYERFRQELRRLFRREAVLENTAKDIALCERGRWIASVLFGRRDVKFPRSRLRGSVSSKAVRGFTSSNAVSLEFAIACGSRGPEHLLGYEEALVGMLSTRTVGAYFMPANSMAEEPTMAITGRTNAISSER